MVSKITGIPYVNSRFILDIDGLEYISFSSVSGIEDATEIQEIREVSNPFKIIKRPGASSNESVVLTRAFTNDNYLRDWRDLVIDYEKSVFNSGAPYRKAILNVLNFRGNVIKRITFYNCWPSKYTVSEFNASQPQILLESIQLEYDKKTIETL